MLDAPAPSSGPARGSEKPSARRGPSQRREPAEDFARRSRVAAASAQPAAETEHYVVPTRFAGLRFRLRGGMPRSMTGRLVAGGITFAAFVAAAAGLWWARAALLHDPRLVIASSSAVEISGNRHLTRAQLLSVFGEDVDRNLLTVPLSTRRAELEALPWVEHATVMRLLPDRVRIAIVERTPVAFVRQGGTIGLVDASGVLLDMSPHDADTRGDAPLPEHFSFPVVTGVNAQDPASVRAARMKLYTRFTSALDADGGRISGTLSEVDLSSPEDVKALVPAGGAEVLVHLGDDDFLARYKRFQANLPGWRAQYPRLASVDMRYERQVVLEMMPGTAVPVNTAATQPENAPAVKPALSKAVIRKPAALRAASPRKAVSPAKPAPHAGHLTQAFAVPAGHQGAHP